MNKTLTVLGLFIITIVLVACSSPIKQYKKTINDLSVIEDVENIDEQWKEIVDLIDVLNTEKTSSEEQMVEDIYQKLIVFDQLIDLVLLKCEKIKTSDTQILNNHNKLKEAINTYKEMSQKASSVLFVEKELIELSTSVEQIYNQLLDITLSGTPTTVEYKNQLNNFTVNNQLYLELFDLQAAKNLLEAEQIDKELIQQQLDDSVIIFTELQKITRYSEEDGEVNSLLVVMYQEIYKMYEIVLENELLIETSNAFETFEEFTNEDLQSIKTYYSEWLLFQD